jgi:hypothetical protein
VFIVISTMDRPQRHVVMSDSRGSTSAVGLTAPPLSSL